jgi:hypothetical protein
MTGETREEMTDAMTEEMIGAMIDVEMIGGVHVPATDETANPHPPEIPPKRQSRLPLSKMKSSRQRGQNWKHGRKRGKPRKPWVKLRPKLWHSLESLPSQVSKSSSAAEYCDFITWSVPL